ncbi:hypothetical protein TcYC6_0005040 [Trypanosoma cruzi]|nr:hypothetical protein TcYC6_0005040 [Trypanosoma cruzi]
MDLSLKHGRILLLLDILRIYGRLRSLISRHKCSCRYGAARELGHQQGLIPAERETPLNIDYANAVADVQNRNDQLNSQVQEAHHNLSVRESNIAGAGNPGPHELQRQLEAAHAQYGRPNSTWEGLLVNSRNGRHAKNAQQPARDAETAGRDEAPRYSNVAQRLA